MQFSTWKLQRTQNNAVNIVFCMQQADHAKIYFSFLCLHGFVSASLFGLQTPYDPTQVTWVCLSCTLLSVPHIRREKFRISSFSGHWTLDTLNRILCPFLYELCLRSKPQNPPLWEIVKQTVLFIRLFYRLPCTVFMFVTVIDWLTRVCVCRLVRGLSCIEVASVRGDMLYWFN